MPTLRLDMRRHNSSYISSASPTDYVLLLRGFSDFLKAGPILSKANMLIGWR
jgi:hypothetical protein